MVFLSIHCKEFLNCPAPSHAHFEAPQRVLVRQPVFFPVLAQEEEQELRKRK